MQSVGTVLCEILASTLHTSVLTRSNASMAVLPSLISVAGRSVKAVPAKEEEGTMARNNTFVIR